MFVLFITKRLHRFDPATGRFRRYEPDLNRPGTLSDYRVNSVHIDRSGTIWVTSPRTRSCPVTLTR